ncbi:MAG TPA: efflux RND transporter periplasmic adaptor subunit [Rhizomicrobium sp.]|nr:efflux RND transporter periplasmic adaptor subunit [Rhizomicrobium sp.]
MFRRTDDEMNAPDRNTQFTIGSADPGGASTRTGFFRRRSVLILGAALMAVLLIWVFWPRGKSDSGFNKDANLQPVPVGVASAHPTDIHVTLNALGTVTPLATVTVKPQVSGILDRIAFKEGQMVRAGDLLAEIDPRPYQAALDQAKGALARDQAQYENAKVDLARYQSLWAQKAISQQILATQEALVRTDAGNIEADRGAVEAAAVNLGFCRITSPVAGRVGLRQVDIGNYVQVGVTTEIVAVTELQPISVLFTVPEDNLPALTQRARSGGEIPVDAYDRAQQTKLATGHLSNMDNQVDPTTGTVKIRALFDNSDGRLFPQQFVNVKILVNTLQRQTAIPVAAIQHGSTGDFVFLVRPGSTVTMRSVVVGPADGSLVAVERGLSPGDVVVVDGADRLRDGSRVVIGSSHLSRGATGTRAQGAHRWRHHTHSDGGGDGGS